MPLYDFEKVEILPLSAPKPVIFLHGKQKAGKTTLADAFIDSHPEWWRTAFAKPLKDGCRIFGVDVDDYSPNKNRKVLQDIGVYFREIDPDWWANLLVARVYEAFREYEYPGVLVDDLRFKNELSAAQDMRSGQYMPLLVKIEVSEYTQALRGAAMDRTQHSSETDLDDVGPEVWDLIIPEESTVEQRVRWLDDLITSSLVKATQDVFL